MQALPAPPTDDLAKFTAIVGLWIVLGCFALLLYYADLVLSYTKQSRVNLSLMGDVEFIESAKRRVESIDNKRLDENRIDGVSSIFTTSVEREFLKNSIVVNERLAKDKMDKIERIGDPLSDIQRLDGLGGRYVFYGVLPFGLLLTALGFLRWKKVNVLHYRNLLADVAIKERQLADGDRQTRWIDLYRNKYK